MATKTRGVPPKPNSGQEHPHDPQSDALNPANKAWEPEGWSEAYPGDDIARPGKTPEGWDEPYPGDDVTRPNYNQPDIDSDTDSEEPDENTTPSTENSQNPQDVESKEANASTADGSSTAQSAGEENLYTGSKGQAFKAAALASGNTYFTLRGMNVNRKKSLIGGAIAGVSMLTIFLGVMGTSSTYLIQLRERLMGPSNESSSIISTHMQKRRLAYISKAVKNSSLKMNTQKYVKKLEAAGVTVEMKGKNVVSFSKVMGYDEKGQPIVKKLTLDKKTQRQIVQQINELARDDLGKQFLKTTDKAAAENIGRFAGAITRRKVYQRIGIARFIDWIRARQEARAGPEAKGELEKIDDPRGQFADGVANRDEMQELERARFDTAAKREEAGLDPDDPAASSKVSAVSDELEAQADEIGDTIKNANGKQVLIGNEENAGVVARNTKKITEALGLANNATLGQMRSYLSDMGGSFLSKIDGKFLQIIGSGFDLSSVPREGCRVAGTLEFIKSVRNILMAAEMMRFAVDVLTVADHQIAGVAQSHSIKLLSLYLAGSSAESTGLQWMLTGGKTAVSSAGIAQYGVGYADVGVLSAISTFLRNVPGLEPENCKIINNPLTQVGATLVGGVIAVLSGGTSASISMGWALSLTLANEAAFAIGVPLIIRAVSHQVVSGFEDYAQAGDLFASGIGELQMSTAMANGALPTSQKAFIGMQEEERDYRKFALSQQSVFDRYFNMNNVDSLVARTAFTSPVHSIDTVGTSIRQFNFANVFNPLTLFSSITDRMTNKTNALDGVNKCEDSAVQKWQIAATPMCNVIAATVPLLDTDQTEKVLREQNPALIDGVGKPMGEFEEFVENCFSGRNGPLRPAKVSTEGESDPDDPTCVIGVEDPTLPGDIPEPQEDGSERIPTKKERFASWYGQMVDQEVVNQQVNDTMAGEASIEAVPAGMGEEVNCENYTEINAVTIKTVHSYSQNVKSVCGEMKSKCETGVTDTEKILCAAFEFDGTYYGNSYGSYSGAKAMGIYGFVASSSNYGLSPKSWLENRSEGLGPNNLLECSGLTSVALYKAYGHEGPGCSGNWTERTSPTLFKQLEQSEIRPGDFLTLTFECNSGGRGHIAIAASTADTNGNIVIYETDSWGKPARFTETNVSEFSGGGWSRYIGPGSEVSKVYE